MVALLPVSKFLLVIVLAELPASAVEAVVDDDVETTDDVDMGDAEDTLECPSGACVPDKGDCDFNFTFASFGFGICCFRL